jgi:hypothetical protein
LEADQRGDLSYAETRVGEYLLGAFEANLLQMELEGDAQLLPEESGEVSRCKARNGGDLGKSEGLGDVAANELERALEALLPSLRGALNDGSFNGGDDSAVRRYEPQDARVALGAVLER